MTFLFLLLTLFLHASQCDNILLNNLTQDTGIIISSQTSGDYLGSSVKNAGDFNGDGYADIIIGSYGANQATGAAYVIFGSKNGLSDLDITAGITASQGVIITGANQGDSLGYSVSYAGDFNDDGVDDVIIGAHQFDGSRGLACVIYGSKNPPAKIDLSQGMDPSQGFVIFGADTLNYFGGSVSYAGDVNNDKIDDVIIGAYGASNSQGAAYVIFGQKGTPGILSLDSGLNPNEGFAILGSGPGNTLGLSVSNAGDIDGDGIADIVIGAPGALMGYVIYGQSSAFSTIDLSQGLSSSQGFRIIGSKGGSMLARSVGYAGDFNDDGYDDVIIGAPFEDSFAGAAYVIFGKARSALSDVDVTAGLGSTVGVKINGASGSMSMLGSSVSGAEDINGDGIDDIVIGAPGVGAGEVYVMFGSKSFGGSGIDLSTGLDPGKGFGIVGSKAGDYAGMAVSFAGDVNGDSKIDVVVGAFGVNSNTGAAYLLFTYPGAVKCPENCLTCDKSSVCKVCDTGYVPSNGGCIQCPANTDLVNGACIPKKSTLETATEVTQGMFDSGSTASRIFTMGRSLSVGLGLMAKIIQNVRFLNISYPQEAQSAFDSYGTDLFELPIPETLYTSPETKTLAEPYAKYGLSPTFLENYWQTIMTILMSLACFLAIKLIQFLTKKQSKSHIIQVALKNLGQTAANFLVIQIYSNLDDVIFFLLLDISTTKLRSFSAGFSLTMAIFFFLLGLALVFFHCWLLGKYQLAKKQERLERFEAKYKVFGTLFEDFKDDNAVKQSFFGILILRCIILVLVIMLLQPPWIQASILMLTNLIFLVYFIYQRPFKSLFDEVSQYFCEATIFVAYVAVLVLSIFDYENEGTASMRNAFGRCIVLAGIVLALGGFIIQVIQIVGVIIGICRFLKGYNRRAQVSISLTMEESQVRNVEGASQMSENSGILRQRSRPRLATDQVELDQMPRKNRIFPSPLKTSAHFPVNGLGTSSINNDNSTFLERSSDFQVINLKHGGDSHRALKSKGIQGSNLRGLHQEESGVVGLGLGLGLTEMNSLVKRKKIKKSGTRGSVLPGLDDV